MTQRENHNPPLGEHQKGLDAFLHREWFVERGAWALFALAIIATLLGAFGGGALSTATAQHNGLTVEYDRFGHRQSPMTLNLDIPAAKPGDPALLWLDRAYVEAMSIQRITPEPRAMRMDADRLLCEFFHGADETLHVIVDLQPRTFGRMRGRLGTGAAGDVQFWQFIYP